MASRGKLLTEGELMDAQRVLINPLNQSASKQQYSFPKAQRWHHIKSQQARYQFYQIPSTKSHIATTIGSSQRNSISKRELQPAPNHYSYIMDGEFGIKECVRKSSKGFVFGLGRDDVKAGNFLRLKTDVPSPSTYDRPPLPHREITFTKDKRGVRPSNTSMMTLGPGSYQIESSLSQEKQLLSNQKRHPSPKIHDIRVDIRRVTQQVTPPLYNPRVTSKGDDLGVSKSKGYRIGTGKRMNLEPTKEYPGPGRYKIFSEFISKGKY